MRFAATILIAGCVLVCSGGCSSALHGAARTGDADRVRALLTQGANAGEKDSDGRIALHCACEYGHSEAAGVLLDAGSDVNARDNDGRTPLLWAALGCSMPCAELLLARGADATAYGGRKHSPLAYNPAFGSPLAAAIDQAAAPPAGTTALHIAAELGQPDMVQLLLSRGANIDARDADGATPLLAACNCLIAPPVRQWVPQKNGGAKEVVIERRNEQIVMLLLEKGASVTVANKSGLTPLHCAVLYKRKAAVEALLAKGADINAKAWHGLEWRTPLRCSRLWAGGDKEIEAVLLQHGATE